MKKADNTVKLAWGQLGKTIVNALRNWFVHPSGKRVLTMDELKVISGFYETYKILTGGSKFRFCQMIADVVDPFQSEFITLNILYNLERITEEIALSLIKTIPEYAMQTVPSWSNPETAMGLI